MLAHLLPLQHQSVSGRATGILRWHRSSTTDTHRRFITLNAVLTVDHAQFPLPLIERAEGVEKLLLAMQPEVAEFFGAGVALEAVELPALNLEGEADAGIPTEYGVKDAIEIGQVQGVRHN
jgi:hypothetical protein